MGRRAVAGVLVAAGLACGYAAMWTTTVTVSTGTLPIHSFSQTYWQVDGTLAGWLLGLLVVATTAALAWFATGRRTAAVVTGIAATLATGTFLFYPVFIGFIGVTSRELGFAVVTELGTGGALGLCTVLVAAGVLLAVAPPAYRLPDRRVAGAAVVLTILGLSATLAAVWLDLGHGVGTYWRLHGGPTAHDLGIALLALIALGAALAAAAYARPKLLDMQRVAAAALVGFTFFFPVGSAWHFGVLGVGVWTSGAGALAFLVGSFLTRPRASAAPPAA